MDDEEFQKMMDEIDTLTDEDLEEETLTGKVLNLEKWNTYQGIVKSLLKLLEMKDPSLHVQSVDYDTSPYPHEKFEIVTLKMDQLNAVCKEAKEIIGNAFLTCDWSTVTSMDDVIRMSFIVDHIWDE